MVTAGSTVGVLLIGELFGDSASNKLLTYSLTAITAAVFPAIYLPTVVDDYEWEYAMTFVPAVSSFAATLTYNVVKRTEAEKTTAESNLPVEVYSTLLADNGAGSVPVYGLSVSF